MTLRNGIRTDAIDDTTDRSIHRDERADVPLSSRMWARLFAARYDQQIEAGATVTGGSPRAAHYVRLTSQAEREDMTNALVLLLRDAGLLDDGVGVSTRVPIQAEAIRKSADVIDDVLSRLADPQLVRARGMARLRILLGDGRGPVYRPGPGSVAAEMRGVLAAM
ncbi:MAG: hypothetical protein QOI01_1922 [Mycobacterium sp.]|nr:hypothetical protein [Mycobacterium sp.]